MAFLGTKRLMSDNRVAGYKIGGLPLNQQIVMYDSTTEKFIFAPVGSANILLSTININANKNWNVQSIFNFGETLTFADGGEIRSSPLTAQIFRFSFKPVAPSTAGTALNMIYADFDDSVELFDLLGNGLSTKTITQKIGATSVPFVLEEYQILQTNDTGTDPIYEMELNAVTLTGIFAIANRSLFSIKNLTTTALQLDLTKLVVYGKTVLTEVIADEKTLAAPTAITGGTPTDLTDLNITLPNSPNPDSKVLFAYEIWYSSSQPTAQTFQVLITDGSNAQVVLSNGATISGAAELGEAVYHYTTKAEGQLVKFSVLNTGSGTLTISGASGSPFAGISRVSTLGMG